MPAPNTENGLGQVQSKLSYRPDIDGLRAIAVLAVLLYHYGAAWLPGGFAGVDIFFVISGYLITRQLAADIEQNGYDPRGLLLRFYNRRIRRIIPAALAVLIVTLTVGWVLLLPGDYASTGESAAYSTFGLGNLYFYWNTGYFDRDAELQPLLHMWSLGVEEQFYLAWPVILLALLWLSQHRIAVVVGAILILISGTFAYAVHLVGSNPKAAFYLPLPRAWELGIGALLAFVPAISNRLLANIFGIGGLALILWSVTSISGGETSPGWSMVPPVLGSALLVWPRAQNLPASALGSEPARWVGLISYSLYLWHWPVLVLFRHYANGKMPSTTEALLLCALAFALAYASWRWVETPFRKARVRPLRVICHGVAAAASICTLAAIIAANDGFTQRVSPEARKMSSLDVMWRWPCPNSITFDGLDKARCVFGAPWDEATTKGILWGDSHAEHMAPLVEAATAGKPFSFILYRECPAALGGAVNREWKEVPWYSNRCSSTRNEMIKFLNSHSEVNLVILSASWTNLGNVVSQDGSLSEALDNYELISYGIRILIEETASPGRKFIVIGDVPQLRRDPIPCALSDYVNLYRKHCRYEDYLVSSERFYEYQGKMYKEIEHIADARSDVIAIFPGYKLCTQEWCQAYIDNEFLYRDGSHLRRNLSHEAKRMLADIIGLTAALSAAGHSQ